MKKLAVIVVALLALASCKDDVKLNDNIQGEWYIYKLIRDNIDKTNLLQDTLKNYRITFSGNNYTEQNIFNTTDTARISGIWEFQDNLATLSMTDTINKTRKFTIFNLEGNHVELRRNGENRYMRKTQ